MSNRNRKSDKKEDEKKTTKKRSRTLKNDQLLIPLDNETVQQRLQQAVSTVISNHNSNRGSKKIGSVAVSVGGAGEAKKRKFN